jgi:hypothetical protein
MSHLIGAPKIKKQYLSLLDHVDEQGIASLETASGLLPEPHRIQFRDPDRRLKRAG